MCWALCDSIAPFTFLLQQCCRDGSLIAQSLLGVIMQLALSLQSNCLLVKPLCKTKTGLSFAEDAQVSCLLYLGQA